MTENEEKSLSFRILIGYLLKAVLPEGTSLRVLQPQKEGAGHDYIFNIAVYPSNDPTQETNFPDNGPQSIEALRKVLQDALTPFIKDSSNATLQDKPTDTPLPVRELAFGLGPTGSQADLRLRLSDVEYEKLLTTIRDKLYSQHQNELFDLIRIATECITSGKGGFGIPKDMTTAFTGMLDLVVPFERATDAYEVADFLNNSAPFRTLRQAIGLDEKRDIVTVDTDDSGKTTLAFCQEAVLHNPTPNKSPSPLVMAMRTALEPYVVSYTNAATHLQEIAQYFGITEDGYGTPLSRIANFLDSDVYLVDDGKTTIEVINCLMPNEFRDAELALKKLSDHLNELGVSNNVSSKYDLEFEFPPKELAEKLASALEAVKQDESLTRTEPMREKLKRLAIAVGQKHDLSAEEISQNIDCDISVERGIDLALTEAVEENPNYLATLSEMRRVLHRQGFGLLFTTDKPDPTQILFPNHLNFIAGLEKAAKSIDDLDDSIRVQEILSQSTPQKQLDFLARLFGLHAQTVWPDINTQSATSVTFDVSRIARRKHPSEIEENHIGADTNQRVITNMVRFLNMLVATGTDEKPFAEFENGAVTFNGLGTENGSPIEELSKKLGEVIQNIEKLESDRLNTVMTLESMHQGLDDAIAEASKTRASLIKQSKGLTRER